MKNPLYFVLWAFVLMMSFLSPSSWSMDEYDMSEDAHLILNSQQNTNSNNSCRQLCPFYLGTCAACFEINEPDKSIVDIGTTTGKLVKKWRDSSAFLRCFSGVFCGAESIYAPFAFFFFPDLVADIMTQGACSLQELCLAQSAITLWGCPCLCQTALCFSGAACSLINKCCTACPNESYMKGLKKGRDCKAPGCFGNEVCLEKTICCLDMTFFCAWFPCLSSEYSCVKSYIRFSIKCSTWLMECSLNKDQ